MRKLGGLIYSSSWFLHEKKAKTDPEIGVEELYYDVYEENLQGKLRGLLPWETHDHKKTQKAINI